MAVNRLFEILYILLDRERVTAPELAEKFEVSVRTIYRDIDALSASGVPVYSAPGRGGGISLLEGYRLDRTVFSPEEQRQLLTALRTLPSFVGQDPTQTAAKLAALFRQPEPDWLQVDLSGWGTEESSGVQFHLLRQAILERRQVEFVYMNSCGGRCQRCVLPARLVFKGQGWYLQAFCLIKRDWRTFKVRRMLDVTIQEKTFTEILDPPSIGFYGENSPPFSVLLTLRFASWMAFRVYDDFDPSVITLEEDGSLLVQVLFPEDQWLYGYLLSFGVGVEVVSPENIRHRLGLLAKQIWCSYSELDTGCQDFCATMGTWSTKQEKQEVPIMHDQFCQSCSMPLSPDTLGTETDGSKSTHYCNYCYQNGAFTGEMTMEEMIDFCVPHMVQAHPDMTAEQAKAQMQQFFPMLMRWRKG